VRLPRARTKTRWLAAEAAFRRQAALRSQAPLPILICLRRTRLPRGPLRLRTEVKFPVHQAWLGPSPGPHSRRLRNRPLLRRTGTDWSIVRIRLRPQLRTKRRTTRHALALTKRRQPLQLPRSPDTHLLTVRNPPARRLGWKTARVPQPEQTRPRSRRSQLLPQRTRLPCGRRRSTRRRCAPHQPRFHDTHLPP
jgi:hypothetical protein